MNIFCWCTPQYPAVLSFVGFAAAFFGHHSSAVHSFVHSYIKTVCVVNLAFLRKFVGWHNAKTRLLLCTKPMALDSLSVAFFFFFLFASEFLPLIETSFWLFTRISPVCAVDHWAPSHFGRLLAFTHDMHLWDATLLAWCAALSCNCIERCSCFLTQLLRHMIMYTFPCTVAAHHFYL